MKKGTAAYIAGVALCAVAAAALLRAAEPVVSASAVRAVVLLSVLAAFAEILVILLPRSARGSIAFVPYLAMIVLVPTWATIVAVFLVKSVTETVARNRPYKAVFNVAQHTLALALAILVYRMAGGISLVDIRPATLRALTVAAGVPSLVAFTTSYITNALLVSLAIAIDTETPVLEVWRDVKLATVGLDLLASPFIFVFAWVYAAYGAIAAVILWVPILVLRQAYKTNVELAQTNGELLELMVKSLEARDPYTSGHSRRVQYFSTVIARALGLNAREIERISRAALLHDVGKIHEKYAAILSKTERLSAEEWALMKEHPADGANLVATMTKLRDVVPAIRHHHENWDGTGYPDGVAGELIPMASRIIRIADTIDAMTSDRPYRRALGEAEVRSEIVRCRATQFDPAIADALLSSALWQSLFRIAPTPSSDTLAVVGSIGQASSARVDIHAERGVARR